MKRQRDRSRILEGIIETDRLILKPLMEDDLPFFTDLSGDPDVMFFSTEGPRTPERAKDVLSKMLSDNAKYGFSSFVLYDKHSGEKMEICGVWWEDENGCECDFGYRFFKRFWGRGYATESAQATIAYLTDHFPDVTFHVHVHPDNRASVRVAEKSGFHYLGKTNYHGISVLRYQLSQRPKHIGNGQES